MEKPNSRKGNSLLEFTLVGIPLIFVLISTVEMARGMWLYHTLAYSVREATRFVIVKGRDCAAAPNACSVTVGRVAQQIRQTAVGLDPNAMQNVTLSALAGRTITCPTLQSCLGDNTPWPTSAPGSVADPGSAPGADIEISATYPFQSAIAMFWPGAGKGMHFGTIILPASSRESIQF